MTRTAVICSEELWQRGHGENHPLKAERLQRAYELLIAYEAFDGQQSRLIRPRPATSEELLLFHTEEYLNAVRSLSRGEREYAPGRYNFGPGDNPVFEGMYETAARLSLAWMALSISATLRILAFGTGEKALRYQCTVQRCQRASG